MSERPPPERDELAEALGSLRPRPVELDRDRLMFRAGQAAAAARYRRWQWGGGLLTVSSLCLTLALLLRPAPEPQIRTVHIPAAVPHKQLKLPVAPDELTPPTEPAPAAPAVPGTHAWHLEKALLQANLDEPVPLAGLPETEENATPVGRRVRSCWEWRRDLILHPSILEEGE
jgi:hypothetical protein